MRPFDDYVNMPTVPFVSFYQFSSDLSKTESHKTRLQEIDATPLTSKQRSEALQKLSEERDEAYSTWKDTYDAEVKRVWDIFLQDCRDELKYPEFMTEEGVKWLEETTPRETLDDYERRSSYEIFFDNLKGQIEDIHQILSYVKVK